MSKLLRRKVLVPTAIIVGVLVVLSLLPIPKVALWKITIAPEKVFDLFGFPITNSLLASWLTMLVLIVGAWAITRRMQPIPRRWQGLLEMLIETMYRLVEGAAGSKWARRFFPIVMTIFVFVLVSNWLGLTPLFGGWGVLHESDEGKPVEWLNDSGTLGLWPGSGASEAQAAPGEGQPRYEFAPMLRSAATDMNTTVALALVSVVLTQYFGLRARGLPYFGKFIAVRGVVRALTKPGLGCVGRIGAFFMGLIDVFVGVIESISEFGKIISFSFRLFGNISAGEVLLMVVAFLIPYLVSLPFFGLELFVGFVQALVFMMLTVAFFVTAISSHGSEEH